MACDRTVKNSGADEIGINDTWHDEVDLSLCFEDTAILYAICTVFWLLAALRFVFHSKQPPRHAVLCAVIVITGLCDLVKTVVDVVNDSSEVPNYQIISPILLFSAALMIAVIINEASRPLVSNSTFGEHWSFMLEKGEDVFRFITFVINSAIIVLQCVLSLLLDKLSGYRHVGVNDNDNPSPELSSSFLSYLTWWWLNKMILKGWRRALTNSDLWSLNPNDRSQAVAPRLAKNWQHQLNKAKPTDWLPSETLEESQETDSDSMKLIPLSSSSKDESFKYNSSTLRDKHASKPSLFLALCKIYIRTFLIAGFLKLINDLLNFVGPQILKLLIEYIKSQDDPSWRGYFYSGLLFVSALTQSLVLQHLFTFIVVLFLVCT